MDWNFRLSDDHSHIDRLFIDAFAILEGGKTPVNIIDRIWARLAVHIRAEHLHLFPMIGLAARENSDPETMELIGTLRADHDFFMKRFGESMKLLREWPNTDITNDLRTIFSRLATHNEMEEKQIYPLVETWLSDDERRDLMCKMTGELENAPSRFTGNW